MSLEPAPEAAHGSLLHAQRLQRGLTVKIAMLTGRDTAIAPVAVN
jgi:hypothetical protein